MPLQDGDTMLHLCKSRRISPPILLSLLRDRELGGVRRRQGNHFARGGRDFYHAVPIQRTRHIYNRPQFHPLRFTPNGEILVGFGAYLQEVQLYKYAGIQAAMDPALPPERLFETLFPTSTRVNFWTNRSNQPQDRFNFGQLSRDCCLVTADSRHLIVCSHVVVSESGSVLGGIIRGGESLPVGIGLEDVTVHSLDLTKGAVVDSVRFPFDLIHPSQCICLLDRTLAVLSLQHQIVHVFRIDSNSGRFMKLAEISRSKDNPPFSATVSDQERLTLEDDPLTECWLTEFRQRFLSFLFRQHAREGRSVESIRKSGFYRELKMQRLQFVEAELLLIRMDLHASRTESSTSSSNHLFVLLEWRTKEILGVYEKNSTELLRLFERYHESFKCAGLNPNFPTSLEHCGRLQAAYDYAKAGQLASGPMSEFARKLLQGLPSSANTLSIDVPYLDPQAFNTDEKLLLHLERGKLPHSEQPLRVFSRRTRRLHVLLRFNESSTSQYVESGASTSNYTARVLFHPYDPFAFSCNYRTQPDPAAVLHTP